MSKVAICYLGSRGAGLRLYSDLKESMIGDGQSKDVVFICRARGTIPAVSTGVKEFEIPGFSTVFELINFSLRLLGLKSYLRNLIKSEQIKRIYFVMPSPADWFIHRFCESNGIEIIHTIHDAVNHPGEIWPLKRSISWRVKRSNFIICFSSYVSEMAKRYHPDVTVKLVQHPYFLPRSSQVLSGVVVPSKYFLFIGRNRAYKGLKIILNAFLGIQTNSALVVAGEGMVDAEGLNDKNVVVLNRWLTDDEHDALIANAQVVCLPYLEASQSGVLATAMFYKRFVVASKVGGLQEQANKYDRVSWVQPNDHVSLASELVRLDSLEGPYAASSHSAVELNKQGLSSYIALRKAFMY